MTKKKKAPEKKATRSVHHQQQRKAVRRSQSTQNSQLPRRQGSPSIDRKKLSANRKRMMRKKRMRQGCILVVVTIILIAAVMAMISYAFNHLADDLWDSANSKQVTKEVMSYASLVAEKAEENDIPAFKDVLLAIMMQESKGRGGDPMQSSECIYNTQYERHAGSIQDPVYSIECGVLYFKDCLTEAGCVDPDDETSLKLAIQGYNFGHGYVGWAMERYGGYTVENATEFSELMQAETGWSIYGDPEYANKVMDYYYKIIAEE